MIIKKKDNLICKWLHSVEVSCIIQGNQLGASGILLAPNKFK